MPIPYFPAQTILYASQLNRLVNASNLIGGYDVITYGALGNGIADDRAAIQAAIDAATGNPYGELVSLSVIYETTT